jgi:hypothetical protein
VKGTTLSKRVWLCRDAIHHAVTPRWRIAASPRLQPPDAMRPRTRAAPGSDRRMLVTSHIPTWGSLGRFYGLAVRIIMAASSSTLAD